MQKRDFRKLVLIGSVAVLPVLVVLRSHLSVAADQRSLVFPLPNKASTRGDQHSRPYTCPTSGAGNPYRVM